MTDGPDGVKGLRRKSRVGIVLLLVGLLLTVVMVPAVMGTTHDHVTMPVAPGETFTYGPYEFHGGNVAVWVEDYYGDFGDTQDFQLDIADSRGLIHGGWRPGGYETRDIDGTRCVLVGGFGHLIEEEWSIEIYNSHGSTDITNSTVEVYIIEGPNAVEMVLFAVGIVMLTLGIVWLFFFRSGRRTRSTDDEE
jgi:hypothetical protein